MKILNFGSLNVDYIYEVEHFVRPGETISSKSLTLATGGKGLNQSIALARAGAEVWHAGAIGQTDEAMLKDLLRDSGVHTEFIQLLAEPSGHAIIQVDDQGSNCIVLYGGANQKIHRDFVDKVLENFEAEDILLLQNEISSIDYIMEKAHERGMRIYLNPSPANELLNKYPVNHVDTLILNEVEGAQLTGQTAPEQILAVLLEKYSGIKVVLTLGEQGVIYTDGALWENHGIFPTKVVDTTAAGDTFTGYFIAATAKGIDIRTTLKYASAAAALSVSKLGAAASIPTLKEVDCFLAL